MRNNWSFSNILPSFLIFGVLVGESCATSSLNDRDDVLYRFSRRFSNPECSQRIYEGLNTTESFEKIKAMVNFIKPYIGPKRCVEKEPFSQALPQEDLLKKAVEIDIFQENGKKSHTRQSRETSAEAGKASYQSMVVLEKKGLQGIDPREGGNASKKEASVDVSKENKSVSPEGKVLPQKQEISSQKNLKNNKNSNKVSVPDDVISTIVFKINSHLVEVEERLSKMNKRHISSFEAILCSFEQNIFSLKESIITRQKELDPVKQERKPSSKEERKKTPVKDNPALSKKRVGSGEKPRAVGKRGPFHEEKAQVKRVEEIRPTKKTKLPNFSNVE